MTETYLLPMAQNLLTGQTQKSQDLTGARFTHRQRRLAEDMASQMADKLTAKTGEPWQGVVKEYTPSTRRV